MDTDAPALQNKWLDVEWEFKASNSGGYLRWVIRDYKGYQLV